MMNNKMIRKKWNKKGLEFKSAIFALIAMSMMIIATGAWLTEWGDDYGSGITNDLSEYNKLDDLSDEADSQQSKVVIKSTDTGTDFEGTSIRGVFGVLNNIYSSFNIVMGEGGIIDSLEDRFFVPDYIPIGLVTFFMVAITFTLVAIFFRLPRRSA